MSFRMDVSQVAQIAETMTLRTHSYSAEKNNDNAALIKSQWSKESTKFMKTMLRVNFVKQFKK